MRKMKKGMAVALTASMVLGSALTVFASDVSDSTTGSGSTQGTGTTEGHVNKEVVNMVLPTIESGSTPFAYIMDPERLIQETDGNKYAEGTIFPEKDQDTGVYFLTDENTYANTSKTLQAINKSSCDVTLSVKVKATAGSNDITLATSDTPSTTDAELYLGLKVGGDSKVVKATEETVTKTVAGSTNNFEIVIDENNKYVYKEKADATTWKAMNISMTGAVSNGVAIEEDTTAPTVEVTWSYEKAADGATVATDSVDYITAPADADPSITNITDFTKASPENVVISFDLGKGTKAVDADGIIVKQGASKTVVNTAKCIVDMDAKTVTIDKSAGFLTGASADVPIYVILTKDGNNVKELAGTIGVN